MHFHVEIQVAHRTHKKRTMQTDELIPLDDLPITNHTVQNCLRKHVFNTKIIF